MSEPCCMCGEWAALLTMVDCVDCGGAVCPTCAAQFNGEPVTCYQCAGCLPEPQATNNAG